MPHVTRRSGTRSGTSVEAAEAAAFRSESRSSSAASSAGRGRVCSGPPPADKEGARSRSPLRARRRPRRSHGRSPREGGRDQQLRTVRLDIRVRREAGRPPEIADRAAVRVGALKEQPVGVERPVGDTRPVHPTDSPPQIVQHRVGGVPRRPTAARPEVTTTSKASFATDPAATTGRTGTSARSASSVTKASCSTCWRRLSVRVGDSSRYHRNVQIVDRSCPSHASRP